MMQAHLPDLATLVRQLTLRQLEIFQAVVRLGSFSRAATTLHLTQPSVSMQVKKLSETVGRPLFEQIGKRIHLTETGQVLHQYATEVFLSLERLQMALAQRDGLAQGRLRLAVVSTAAYFAPRVLGAFNALHSGVEVELRVCNRLEILARVADNADDLYILGQPPERLNAVSKTFLPNPHVALAHGGHPLAGQRRIPLARFAQEPMIVREHGSGTRKAMEDLFQAAGLEMHVKMELGSAEAIKQAVAGGLGVTVLSAHTLALVQDSPLFAVLDVQGFPLRRHWHLVYPRGKVLSPVAQAFEAFLLQEAAALAPPLQHALSIVSWTGTMEPW